MNENEYEEEQTFSNLDIKYAIGGLESLIGSLASKVRQRIVDDGKDLRLYRLTAENVEETKEWVHFKVYADQVAELRDGEIFSIE